MARSLSAPLLSLLLLLTAPITAASAEQAEIQPHRALYAVELAGSSEIIQTAHGLAATEVRLTCDGWRYRQRYEIELTPTGGEPSRTVFQMSSRESLDGASYGFDAASDFGDGELLRLVGRAEATADGGEVRYTEPEAQTRPLPAGTAFAIGVVKKQLEAALLGADRAETFWFVGATLDEPLFIVSQILSAEAPPDATGLLAGPRWRLISGFYNDPREAVPLYEGEETVLQNGVLADAVYHYDGYALRLTLQRLEPLPSPDC